MKKEATIMKKTKKMPIGKLWFLTGRQSIFLKAIPWYIQSCQPTVVLMANKVRIEFLTLSQLQKSFFQQPPAFKQSHLCSSLKSLLSSIFQQKQSNLAPMKRFTPIMPKIRQKRKQIIIVLIIAGIEDIRLAIESFNPLLLLIILIGFSTLNSLKIFIAAISQSELKEMMDNITIRKSTQF